MSAALPPPEPPHAPALPATIGRDAAGSGGQPPAVERRRLRRRAALAAWRSRLARALLRRLDPGEHGARRGQDRWPGLRHRESGSPGACGEARGDGRPSWSPQRRPRLLLAWQALLTAMALALTLQSLLAPRGPRAELPRGWGGDLRLGDRRLRLLRRLPAQGDRDRAMSETLVFEVLIPPVRRVGAEGALELHIVAVQVRKRSDLALPRLVRDRPDLRLHGVRLQRLTPSFSYGHGWLRGRPAWQTCLTGAAQGGYSEAQLSRLRDQPLAWGWPRVLYLLGLRDNRDFSCLLLTLSSPGKTPDPQAPRQPTPATTAP